MKLDDLINAAKAMSTDSTRDPLWSDEEWVDFANWAEQEACRRGSLLFDSTTASVAVYSLLANAKWTNFSNLVLKVERAEWVVGGVSTLLYPLNLEIMDIARKTWGEDTAGAPVGFLVNGNRFRTYPTVSVPGSLTFRVVRLPAAKMTLATRMSGSPEIPEQYHLPLVSGMLHRAYLKNDSEAFNKGASDLHLADFERVFGPAVPALGFVELLNRGTHIGTPPPREGVPQGA